MILNLWKSDNHRISSYLWSGCDFICHFERMW